ncbi:hypothetical protein [Halalkalicoccus ordinarius]|uniref:hypothetical protein n=1 Tax=Halalkalicoccus ordinarius TaxID=3116651 RepID=UPI00300F3AAF
MEDAVVLEPVRFADGTPYRSEPVCEASEDGDPVAETHLEERGDDASPRAETVNAPIDAAIIDGVVGGTGVDHDAFWAIDRVHGGDRVERAME